MLKLKENKRLFVMPNIEMRLFTLNDAFAYYELYNHSSVKKYIPEDMIPKDLKASAEQISSLFLQNRAIPYWVIVDSQTDQLVGTCGFVGSDFYHKRLEIAYDLHPNFRGKGIMYHSLRVCIKYAFERMAIQRLEAVTLRENIESAKVLLRLGFVHEGTLRSFKFFRGKMRNVESFSFVFEDYKKMFGKNV